jgi:hypothetical protein
MTATNVLVLVLVATLLSGCSIFTKKIDASFAPIAKPELVLPDADEIRMRSLEWYIITPENYEEIFEDLRVSGESVVLLGLTSNGYERISLNLSDVRAFIQQQQSIIKAYQEYYIQSEETMDEINNRIKESNSE